MNSTPSMRFQWRAFTSVLLTLAFLMLALSGSVLFVSPPGRVANWTNWTMLGLRKSDWSGLHIWFSTTFLAMTAFHLAFNWRPLVNYFRNRVSRHFGLRREWALAVGLCGIVFLGTRAAVPPFSSLIAWNEQVKESWDRTAERAPIPHAELLTLAALAERAGIDSATAVARLQAKGLSEVDPAATVQVLAERGKISAQQLYNVVRTSGESGTTPLAGKAGGGAGWKTLRQYCADEHIDFEIARRRLLAKGIAPEESTTLRELAEKSGQKPYDLVALIRAQP